MEEKNIDENWKEAVEREKEAFRTEGESDIPQPDFSTFISSLGLQASIALGVIPNPLNNKKEENLKQARFLIDTLQLLKEKTKGNLMPEEEELLDNILYELRMQYINRSKGIT